ncbi:hypothetical protein SDC9_210891 [bioreactor metagenome]|uniref:Uncharacterized protein n=1 Tax=bioreactor metagenome TaxID=1076179 RepID=A0A645JIG0_9ZZZZ
MRRQFRLKKLMDVMLGFGKYEIQTLFEFHIGKASFVYLLCFR